MANYRVTLIYTSASKGGKRFGARHTKVIEVEAESVLTIQQAAENELKRITSDDIKIIGLKGIEKVTV